MLNKAGDRMLPCRTPSPACAALTSKECSEWNLSLTKHREMAPETKILAEVFQNALLPRHVIGPFPGQRKQSGHHVLC